MILLPILYVLLVEKRSLGRLGFSIRGLYTSMTVGVLMSLALVGMHYPIFLLYPPEVLGREPLSLNGIFLDVVWYPVYEEIA